MAIAAALPYIAAAASIASTVVAVTADKSAASQANDIGQMNASADLTNAKIAQQQADSQATQIRLENEQVRGRQVASFLSSGITLDGSAQDVIYDSSIQGELNALNTQYKGNIAAYQNIAQSRIDLKTGQAKASAYNAAATGSILTGVGSLAGIAANPNFNPKSNDPLYYD